MSDYSTTPIETQQRVISKRAVNAGRKAIDARAKQLERVNILYMPIDDIYPNTYNPNRQGDHEFEMLLTSIEEDGFTTPVVVNQDHVIVDGEHRWRAAAALGMKEIPVVMVDMNDEQMRMSTIRHNRARGTHDIELEAAVLRDLQELGALEWAKDSLGLDDLELNRLLNDVPAPELLAGEDYSEAWVPGTITDEDAALLRQGAELVTSLRTEDGRVIQIATPEAVETQRKREQLLSQAKTEQDRAKARQEHAVFRVSLLFAGDEAELVKAALGTTPAENLVTMCRRFIAGGGA